MNTSRNINKMQEKCNELKDFHVIITLKDGSKFDGIITDSDDYGVTVLVGEDVIENEDETTSRQMPRRYRRYRRRRFPIASLVGLSLLLYPFIAPPYSY
ncbi:hypothetical protein VN21_15695 [Paraclostridium benzoelyticum]|uniref:LSM domain-containing protein n=1 Tax=Paraclostridium benzoelyticum TaxID=1629550 RepID=A0A0M3DDH8_9FIRM|nr:hypothetical protein [Paraclostridium benzoelyticum]KKY00176.1 hypothetical protein VN21_15695 [Paraclostridium benzoelyticum]